MKAAPGAKLVTRDGSCRVCGEYLGASQAVRAAHLEGHLKRLRVAPVLAEYRSGMGAKPMRPRTHP